MQHVENWTGGWGGKDNNLIDAKKETISKLQNWREMWNWTNLCTADFTGKLKGNSHSQPTKGKYDEVCQWERREFQNQFLGLAGKPTTEISSEERAVEGKREGEERLEEHQVAERVRVFGRCGQREWRGFSTSCHNHDKCFYSVIKCYALFSAFT